LSPSGGCNSFEFLSNFENINHAGRIEKNGDLCINHAMTNDQLLGWGVAGALVCSVLYGGWKIYRNGQPSKNAKEPFSGPEHEASRSVLDESLRRAGIKVDPAP